MNNIDNVEDVTSIFIDENKISTEIENLLKKLKNHGEVIINIDNLDFSTIILNLIKKIIKIRRYDIEIQKTIKNCLIEKNNNIRLDFCKIETLFEKIYVRYYLKYGVFLLQNDVGFYTNIAIKLVNTFEKYIDLSDNKECLFVGSGSLPMTAIQLALYRPNIHVTILDKDIESIEVSSELIKFMKVDINVLPSIDVIDLDDINKYDIICIAIMVGYTKQEKIDIYKKIANRLSFGKKIFTRTIKNDDICSIFYEPFPILELENEFKIIDYEINIESIVDDIVIQKI